MANRNTLAKSKLNEFKSYVEGLGYLVDTENFPPFQVLRFKIPNHPMAIIFNGKSPVHYSANEAAVPFVNKFIN
jgi:hypothetical protein